MGMINLMEIFPLSTPKPQVWKEKKKYSPGVFHLVPVSISMYETTYEALKADLPSETCLCISTDLCWWMTGENEYVFYYPI